MDGNYYNNNLAKNDNPNQIDQGLNNRNYYPNSDQYQPNGYNGYNESQNQGNQASQNGLYQGQAPQGYQQEYSQQHQFQGQGVHNYNYPPPVPPSRYGQSSSFPVEWILFIVGWIFPICWIVGAFLPLCRRPRFESRQQKGGWIACLVMACLIIVVIIAAIIAGAVVGSRQASNSYYYNSQRGASSGNYSTQ